MTYHRSRSARTARIEIWNIVIIMQISSSRSARTARIEIIADYFGIPTGVVAVRKDRED